MDAKDLLAPFHVGLVDQHLPIEPARAEQRGVEHFGSVRRAHDDDALARVEAVHLREQLVQRLLALFMAADRTLDADFSQRVELVDENDARRLRFGLLKEIADAGGTYADEHLDEFGSAQAEERHVRLAGNGAGEQRLAGPRRADEQHAFRDPAAEVGVLLRVLEELDDLLQFFFRFVDAGDVREPNLHFIVGVNLRAAARERHDAAFRAAHPPEEEAPDADEEDERNDPAEKIGQPSIDGLARVLHALGFELLGELRIFDARGLELASFVVLILFERAADHLVADRRLTSSLNSL